MVIPKQGFYGRSLAVHEGKVVIGLEGAIWECDVDAMPFEFGLDRPEIEVKSGWENIARAPSRGNGRPFQILACAVSPDGEWCAASGEEGMVVVFRRIPGLEEQEEMQVKREMLESVQSRKPPVGMMEVMEISDED